MKRKKRRDDAVSEEVAREVAEQWLRYIAVWGRGLHDAGVVGETKRSWVERHAWLKPRLEAVRDLAAGDKLSFAQQVLAWEAVAYERSHRNEEAGLGRVRSGEDEWEMVVVRWRCEDCPMRSPYVVGYGEALFAVMDAAKAHAAVVWDHDPRFPGAKFGFGGVHHKVLLERIQTRAVPELRHNEKVPEGPFVVQQRVWNLKEAQKDVFVSIDVGGAWLPNTSRVTHGIGASPGVAEGVARWIEEGDMEKADAFRRGEVLLARYTDVSWEPTMGRAAAIVTEIGAAMGCHAARVARELGVPGVVGVGRGFLAQLDGKRVRVNGMDGTVEVLESKS